MQPNNTQSPNRHDCYVQFGAGLCGPEQWRNFDASPTLRMQKLPLIGRLTGSIGPRFPGTVEYGDIIRGLPVADNSCAAVYCSHVLEHLSLQDLRCALANTFRCLRPSGRFRLVLPDLEQMTRRYVESTEADAANKFMRESLLGAEKRPRGVVERLRQISGNSRHLWMWDFKALSTELQRAGFVSIRRAVLGDSGDSKFEDVERADRWEGHLGIDCFKEKAINCDAA